MIFTIFTGPNTFCVITSKLIHKVNAYIKKDLYDVVKTSWLIKCIENKQYYPWTPFDMFHSTPETRRYFSKHFDQYGDNYTEQIDAKQLQNIFNNMNQVKIDEKTIHYRIAFIENKYFPDESYQYGLFRLCCLYFCKYDKNLMISNFDFLKLKSKWYGAAVCDEIDDSTTHCILDKE
jgi:DNA ligase-4